VSKWLLPLILALFNTIILPDLNKGVTTWGNLCYFQNSKINMS